jgi:hypothetical protein
MENNKPAHNTLFKNIKSRFNLTIKQLSHKNKIIFGINLAGIDNYSLSLLCLPQALFHESLKHHVFWQVF